MTKIQNLQDSEKLFNLFYQRNFPREYCKCFPGCESITYDTEISYANLNLAKYNAAASGEAVDESYFYDEKLSKVSIFFKEEEFHVSKRSELYSGFELVGTIGGLLGLYMGISVLSVLELIYYFSLRLFCISRMQKIEQKRLLLEQQQLQQQLQEHAVHESPTDTKTPPTKADSKWMTMNGILWPKIDYKFNKIIGKQLIKFSF